jgi:hypothetical protein
MTTRGSQSRVFKTTDEPFVGEPGEIIEIKPFVQSDPLYGYFFVQNRNGAVEYSAAFNAGNYSPQALENIKQQFIQELERAGWQHLDEDRMRLGL